MGSSREDPIAGKEEVVTNICTINTILADRTYVDRGPEGALTAGPDDR